MKIIWIISHYRFPILKKCNPLVKICSFIVDRWGNGHCLNFLYKYNNKQKCEYHKYIALSTLLNMYLSHIIALLFVVPCYFPLVWFYRFFFPDVDMNECYMKCKVRIGLNLYRSSVPCMHVSNHNSATAALWSEDNALYNQLAPTDIYLLPAWISI